MNTTVNGSSCSSPLNPTAEKIGATIAYSLIFVVSLIGNSLIGIIVYKTQTLRKPINYCIVNMAMSDLLYPIFEFPRILTYSYVHSWLISGPLGQALCKLSPFLGNVSAVVSIQSLVLIAVDRFGAVVFPLRSPLISSKRCPFFILATWIVAMAVSSPNLFTHRVSEFQGQMFCLNQWNEVFGESSSVENYFLAIYVVFLYIPCMLLIIVYSIIVFKLKSQKIPGEQSTNTQYQRTKRNRNVLKMAIAIVVGFALCWLPVSIVMLMFLFRNRLPCGIFLFLYIAWLIASANCAINPCICFIFSSNYRQGLKRLVCCSAKVMQPLKTHLRKLALKIASGSWNSRQ